MKKLVIAAMALLSINAHALTKKDCMEIGELAESVMVMRQSGYKAHEVLASMDKVKATELEIKLYLQIVDIAYSRPVFLSDEKRKYVSLEFNSEIFITCIRSIAA